MNTDQGSLQRLEPQQEDLRPDRGLAESADRRLTRLRLSGRYRLEAQLGRRGQERFLAGGDRRQRRRLP